MLLALSLMLGCGSRESERIVGGKAFSQWKALATNEKNSLAVRKEASLLKRNTLWPRQDFVVLKLTPKAVDPIFQQVLAAGLKRSIINVQIERNGVLELAAYDNLEPECVITGPGISASLLDQLSDQGVLWGAEMVPTGSK